MLSLRHISKRFGGVRALQDVSFEVARGSIHAIVGENGAGKSTLMKIVAGVQPPASGTIALEGNVVHIASPRRARELGIALVPQEPALCPNLTVAENLHLGREPQTWGMVQRSVMNRRAEAALERAALPIAPDLPVERLTAAQRHLLQIARALAEDAKLLILDEPTAALSENEAQNLFARLRRLQQEGVTILYISHRLPEIFALCDTITVLRDGQHVATQPASSVQPNDIVAQMVGRELAGEEAATEAQIAQTASRAATVTTAATPLLRVENLAHESTFNGVSFSDVSFEVRRGEIVTLAGLVGSGRSEIARCIFGLERPTAGAMWLDGKPFAPRAPRDAVRAGIALVPEERREQGLVMPLSVRENLALPALAAWQAALTAFGLVRTRDELNAAGARVRELAIKTDGLQAGVDTLSGGNAQKVVIGKWLTLQPRLLIVDEPTQGVDVGAKAQVHRLLRELAAQGCGVLMISSDLPEVLHLSHRILVLRQGRLVGELHHGATAADVMRLAALGSAR